MKKVLLLSIMVVYSIISLFSQNEYIVNTNNQNKYDKEIKISKEHEFIMKNFITIPIENWSVGMKFIIEEPFDENYSKYSIYDDNNKIYPRLNRHVYKNKIIKIDSIKDKMVERIGTGSKKERVIYFNCDGNNFEYSEPNSTYIFNLIYLGDIENARKLLIGKTLYTLTTDWFEDGIEGTYKYSKKWVPVTITKIGVGRSQNSPVKIIFEYNSNEFYIEISLSKTNCNSLSDKSNDFESNFQFVNPKLKYPNISNEIWNYICLCKVKVGMTKKQCLLSWGDPEKINKTTGKWGIHEQWVYSDTSYLYFENGILTSIQN